MPVFDKDQLAVLKSLVEPHSLVASITDVQSVREMLESVVHHFDGTPDGRLEDSEFAAGLREYMNFYDAQVKS